MSRSNGRPRGDLRGILAQVFAQSPEALTWRAAAARLVADGHLASVGASELQRICRTVVNMAQAGELKPCGQVRHARCNRPMTAFRLATAADEVAPLADTWALMAKAVRP